MGQKVNPIAVRLNFNRFSDSSWFSDYYYSILLYQDFNFRQYLSSLRQPNANKLGFRPAKSIIHHFPKRSLIHLFCLSDPRERNGSFIGGQRGSLRRSVLSAPFGPLGGRIISTALLQTPSALLWNPYCFVPVGYDSALAGLVKAGPGGRILVEARRGHQQLDRCAPRRATSNASRQRPVLAKEPWRSAFPPILQTNGPASKVGPNGRTNWLGPTEAEPQRQAPSALASRDNPGQEPLHDASHSSGPRLVDRLEVSTSWYNSSMMQKKKALINLNRAPSSRLLDSKLFLNCTTEPSHRTNCRRPARGRTKSVRCPNWRTQLATFREGRRAEGGTFAKFRVLLDIERQKLGASTESSGRESLPERDSLRVLAMTRSVVNYYFNLFAMEYYFMRYTNKALGETSIAAWRSNGPSGSSSSNKRPTYQQKWPLRNNASEIFISSLARLGDQMVTNFSGQITRSLDFYLSNVKSILSQNTNTFISLRPLKARSVFQCASLVAQEIACKLEQKKSFRLICRLIFQQLADCKNIKGIRVTCSGRLNGAEIAKTECRKFGETSLHVFSDKIDYARTKASTPFGILGVKVWISYI